MSQTKKCHSIREVRLAKVSVFYHFGGSKWCINDSYACSNTWVRVIYASFDPPSGDSLCKRDIQKCIPLTTPLTKNFFEYRTNMCISCYWSMCMHSTWSVTLSGVCIYILGPILPYFIFQQCVNYARNSHFHDMIVYLGVRYGNQVS